MKKVTYYLLFIVLMIFLFQGCEKISNPLVSDNNEQSAQIALTKGKPSKSMPVIEYFRLVEIDGTGQETVYNVVKDLTDPESPDYRSDLPMAQAHRRAASEYSSCSRERRRPIGPQVPRAVPSEIAPSAAASPPCPPNLP